MDASETEDTFIFEFTSHKKVTISACIGENFVDLKNHFGDFDELDVILIENGWKPDFKKNKEDIHLFKSIMKLGFEHVGKSCNDEFSKTFSSTNIKVNTKEIILLLLVCFSIINIIR